MRLSEWAGRAPHKESLTPKVRAAIVPGLTALGAAADPSCWIAWGDDPSSRYVIFAPTDAGLIQAVVRVNVPQEGPRASAKLIRWNRVQTGELAVEVTQGHRLMSFQVEGQVLRGSDDEAQAIGAFAQELFAGMDGRPTPDPGVFMQFLPVIKQSTDAVINITTGGGLGMSLSTYKDEFGCRNLIASTGKPASFGYTGKVLLYALPCLLQPGADD